ncbi:inositol polyphosphate-5-phosphatase A isoform X4 [Drosophila sulfurigaster albostrigata]|uniref:inositol polyphosphate-5-phosphatase A isoform X4 n=1 Tax=Drosophila sulfurigaster albostrigata TaxID=89887 RepID=UPI002D2196C2|nr:inositol polyphosphate-5-phosphatase A isoform X4 [Drosophila sulfurigaster albostrigata]
MRIKYTLVTLKQLQPRRSQSFLNIFFLKFHLDDKNGSVPFFCFGDFNFRCDTAGVVKELTANLVAHRVQSIKTDNTKIHYRNSIGNNILTLGKKEFSHADHQLKFKEYWLKNFDKELEPLTEILIEYPINFIPSYPFEEDPEMPTDYMSTRCPSWCDRILMTPQVNDIIACNEWKYDIIGESVCMGDHKPIYLTVRLKQNKGSMRPRKAPNLLKTLMENTMVDDSLWMEQSNVEDASTSAKSIFNSQYIMVKAISPNISKVGKDESICPEKLNTDHSGVLLKETTV